MDLFIKKRSRQAVKSDVKNEWRWQSRFRRQIKAIKILSVYADLRWTKQGMDAEVFVWPRYDALGCTEKFVLADEFQCFSSIWSVTKSIKLIHFEIHLWHVCYYAVFQTALARIGCILEKVRQVFDFWPISFAWHPQYTAKQEIISTWKIPKSFIKLTRKSFAIDWSLNRLGKPAFVRTIRQKYIRSTKHL